MTDRVRWGILSTAKIGTQKVIPAMQLGEHSAIQAIASRDLAKAHEAALELGIPTAYGSYEDLLADSEVDAVYVPLPNHLHVEWSIRALEAGKHVLCEKPLGLDVADAEKLLAASSEHPELKVMEAFMYRHHPQWQRAKKKVDAGMIGELRTIQSFFSYDNDDPEDIRNQPETGGGSLMDIGCCCISLSRFLFDAEPSAVLAHVEYDRKLKVDRLASGILEFDGGHSSFTCSTQLAPYQRVHVLGTAGRIEIEIPFNAPPEHPCRLWWQAGEASEEIVFAVCDQYRIQGELFSRAILEDRDVPTPLEDAVANMRVIEAVFASGERGERVSVRSS